MQDDEIRDFIAWSEGFERDDMLHAFRAIKALERIRFELTMREEGFMDRIEEIAEGVAQ